MLLKTMSLISVLTINGFAQKLRQNFRYNSILINDSLISLSKLPTEDSNATLTN